MNFLKKLDRVILFIEKTFLCVGLSAMVGILFAHVIMGYFGKSLPWAGELATYLMVWMTCFGASYATRGGQHIRIEGISDRIRKRTGRTLDFIVALICLGFCVSACVIGIQYVLETREFGQEAVSVKLPLWIVYSALPAAAALMGLRFAIAVFLYEKKDGATGI